mmetsp:Transcript_27948/g.46954  ORF Transcript_27948/g.46954 Transcript_27948/m.46954 type:complete len:511 (-) Transcript_27948:144-1676(-)
MTVGDISVIICSIFATASVSLFIILSFYEQVEDYMDEIFHIPQAQKYCAGNFSDWNPGITTFPGLYLTSYAYYTVLNVLRSQVQCTSTLLRTINTGLAASLLCLLYYCRRQIVPIGRDALFIAFVLFLLPSSFFYYFLFYTDTLSTTTLVATYALSMAHTHKTVPPAVKASYSSSSSSNRNGNSSSSTISGHTASVKKHSMEPPSILYQLLILGCATLCLFARQTNAVWLMFIAGTRMLHLLEQGGAIKDDSISASHVIHFIVQLWQNKFYLLRHTGAFLLPVVGFLVFIYYNGSIVLGDKEHHEPVFHLAMLVHMLCISSVLISPVIVDQYVIDANKSQFLLKHWADHLVTGGGIVLCLLVTYVALMYFSYDHPFLQADNRHYTFYIWRRLLTHESRRLVLVPFYGLAVFVSIRWLRQRRGPLWIGIYLIAAALTLIPTPLLEPRYFTPGIIIAILNSPEILMNNPSAYIRTSLLLCLAAPVFVNIVTIYVFLYRPFEWVDGSIARFMY